LIRHSFGKFITSRGMAMVKVKEAAVRSCLDDPWAATAAAYDDTTADEIRNTVRNILEDVSQRGDQAVTEYAMRFDGSTRSSLELSQAEIDVAISQTPQQVQDDIKAAQNNIRRFAQAQRATMQDLTWEDPEQPGVELGHKHIPISRVGCYIPGGRFPIIAAACMQVVTARAAGCPSVIACTPGRADCGGGPHPYVVTALHFAGADKIYAVGGVQAVGMMAHGTESCQPVDMMSGPGNAFVAEAKRQLFGKIGIDLFAGPTETLVICDDTPSLEMVVTDLLGQAEHGVNSPAILLTSSRRIANECQAEVERQLATLPTADAASPAWRDFGEILLVDTDEELVHWGDIICSEHTQIMHKDPRYFLKSMTNYGGLFVGEENNVAYGDKCIGTNHTLPTLKAGKYTGGLWVGKFIKTLTYGQVHSREASARIGELCARICKYEGMIGHGLQAEQRVAEWSTGNANWRADYIRDKTNVYEEK